MIERFHRSLKPSLQARLASSNWVAHLPLVMLGLRSLPKDNSEYSPEEAVYVSNLSLPGEFLEHTELPPESFLHKVDQAIQGFSGPPQHHMIPQPQPRPLPRALMEADFVFVRDDASKPLLSFLYRGPYRVLRQSENFFIIQIGDISDSVSVDRLKPVISSVPGVTPVRSWPHLNPASIPGPPVKDRPPVKKVTFSPVKRVRFSPVPATQLCRNPHWTVQDSWPLSDVLRPHLLGGVTVATANLMTTLGTSCSLSPPSEHAWRSPRLYACL